MNDSDIEIARQVEFALTGKGPAANTMVQCLACGTAGLLPMAYLADTATDGLPWTCGTCCERQVTRCKQRVETRRENGTWEDEA